MIHIVTSRSAASQHASRRLPFYLAVEEWVARRMPASEYFFTWRVEPTVIFGRNQDIAKEVDLQYCRDHGIQVYRRRSGGGCVYADLGNLMLSCVSPRTEVQSTFASFTAGVADMLRSLGVPAEATGRNDVVVRIPGEGGTKTSCKVSGNAFYHLPTRSVMHGTLLFDTIPAHMARAITPSRSKLESHRVASVASRVATLSSLLPGMDIEGLERHIIDFFTDSEYVLSDSDLAEVSEIEQRYYDLKWIFGRTGVLADAAHTARAFRRFPGVGDITAVIRVLPAPDGVGEPPLIDDVQLTGDFFMVADLDSAILDRIRGVPLSLQAVTGALASTDVSQAIPGLSTAEFAALIASARLPERKLI